VGEHSEKVLLQKEQTLLDTKLVGPLNLDFPDFRTIRNKFLRGQNRFCLEVGGFGGRRREAEGSGERWPKQCIHI
jgi:hypothetical protein